MRWRRQDPGTGFAPSGEPAEGTRAGKCSHRKPGQQPGEDHPGNYRRCSVDGCKGGSRSGIPEQQVVDCERKPGSGAGDECDGEPIGAVPEEREYRFRAEALDQTGHHGQWSPLVADEG